MLNPFGTSRVDNPFQHHADVETLFADQFLRLTALVDEIRTDPNHQSKGVVLTGDPGAGKTHMIMRLARKKIQSNRILFVRQPNNPESIFYHIYSRMLESLVEEVFDTPYTQIEYLLARSFSRIVIQFIRASEKPTAAMQNMEKRLAADHLNIYTHFAVGTSERRRKNWRFIESRTLEWWGTTHGFGGNSAAILKTLIKYCSYSDLMRREIVRKWLSGNELSESEQKLTGLENHLAETGLEEFAMEAIAVLGKLSIEDEPLIMVFDQLEGLKYNEVLLQKFGDCVKELFTHIPNTLMIFNLFPERWVSYSAVFDKAVVERMGQNVVALTTPSPVQMKEILNVRGERENLNLDDFFDREAFDVILGKTSIRDVLNTASDYFRFKIDNIPLPENVLSFKEQVARELDSLRQEIDWLKTHLNMPVPTFRDTRETEIIKELLEKCRNKAAAEYDAAPGITDSDDVGKLHLILTALIRGTDFKTGKLKKNRKKLPEHVLVKNARGHARITGFLHADGNAFTARLKNYNGLTETHKDDAFILLRDERVAKIKSKVARQEIEKLNAFENGRFQLMDRGDRILFETIYRLITDIQNREIEADLDRATRVLRHVYHDYWLIKLVNPGE